MRRGLTLFLPLLGLVLFVVIVAGTGVERILDVFRAADRRGLAATPALILLILVLRGLRWQVILRGLGVPLLDRSCFMFFLHTATSV